MSGKVQFRTWRGRGKKGTWGGKNNLQGETIFGSRKEKSVYNDCELISEGVVVLGRGGDENFRREGGDVGGEESRRSLKKERSAFNSGLK